VLLLKPGSAIGLAEKMWSVRSSMLQSLAVTQPPGHEETPRKRNSHSKKERDSSMRAAKMRTQMLVQG
jgi:hypothetical protein